MLPYIKIQRVYLLQYQKFIHEIVFLEFSFFLVRKAFRNKTFHGMSGLDNEKMKTKQNKNKKKEPKALKAFHEVKFKKNM